MTACQSYSNRVNKHLRNSKQQSDVTSIETTTVSHLVSRLPDSEGVEEFSIGGIIFLFLKIGTASFFDSFYHIGTKQAECLQYLLEDMVSLAELVFTNLATFCSLIFIKGSYNNHTFPISGSCKIHWSSQSHAKSCSKQRVNWLDAVLFMSWQHHYLQEQYKIFYLTDVTFWVSQMLPRMLYHNKPKENFVLDRKQYLLWRIPWCLHLWC